MNQTENWIWHRWLNFLMEAYLNPGEIFHSFAHHWKEFLGSYTVGMDIVMRRVARDALIQPLVWYVSLFHSLISLHIKQHPIIWQDSLLFTTCRQPWKCNALSIHNQIKLHYLIQHNKRLLSSVRSVRLNVFTFKPFIQNSYLSPTQVHKCKTFSSYCFNAMKDIYGLTRRNYYYLRISVNIVSHMLTMIPGVD